MDNRPCTDLGNAERLVDKFGMWIRHTSAFGWLVWTGQRWQVDDGSALIMQHCKTVARSIHDEAMALSDEPRVVNGEKKKSLREVMLAHGLRSESERGLRAMANVACWLPGVHVAATEFDDDPWLLNLADGVMDLRNCTWHESKPEQMCRKMAPITYDPMAECPTFMAFLNSVQPDPACQEFIQLFLGYSLTGVVRDHMFPIWQGGGRNGKGTLIEEVAKIMGDYAVAIDPGLLLERQNEAHPTERMQLLGARLVFCSEPDEKKGLSMSIIKRLTGNDTISAHYMHKDNVTFKPTHKIVLLVNPKPIISAQHIDIATWDRIRLLEWNSTFTRDLGNIDTELPEKLRAEAAGIFAWMVQGCERWNMDGVNYPESVRKATDIYRAETDTVRRWVDDNCHIADDKFAEATSLRANFEKWCADEGFKGAVGPAIWSRRLKELGAVHPLDDSVAGGKSGGRRFWRGIGLLDNTQVDRSDQRNYTH